jgi:hypothetical protein
MRRPDWWPVAATPDWQLDVGAGELALRTAAGDTVARETFDGAAALAPLLAKMLAAYPRGTIQAWTEASAARLFLLPWADSLTSRARWSTYASSRFEQSFGDAASSWSIRVADDTAPRARLAAALPLALIEALRIGSGGRVASLRIGLIEQLARLLARERRFAGCVVEPGASVATLLVLVRGELRRVRTRRFDVADDLIGTARSEWASFGIAGAAADAAIALPADAVGTLGPALAAAVGAVRVLALPRLNRV